MKSTQKPLRAAIATLLAASLLPLALNAAMTNPSPKKTVAPQLSSEIRQESGEVNVLVEIDEYGFVTEARISESSNSSLNEAALDAIYQWTFNPATNEGVAVPSKAVQPFYFNDGSIVLTQKAAPEDTLPSVRKSVKPELDEELNSITGEVVLQASVNAQGQVERVEVKSSTHGELEASASDALAKWTFKPATKAGVAVSSRIIIPFHFNGERATQVVAKANVDRAPVPERRPTPELPRHLGRERGEAKLSLTVDEFGYVATVEVLESSNQDLSEAAREAALQWKFKPALKDGQAVAATVIQPFSFNGGLLTADLPVDSMPTVKRSVSPRLPEELANIKGFVKVRLNLDSQGRVLSASCDKTSHDELIAPTLEAAKEWTFKPAVRDGESVSSSVVVPFLFNERS